jgi:hypothetical protein
MPTWLITLLPALINAAVAAVNAVSKSTGKPPGEAVLDVISHLTPGMPNAPSLSHTAVIEPPTDAAQ